MNVSLIIPAYNEQAVLPHLRSRVAAVLATLPEYEFEVLLVDDHSTDATPELIAEWARADARVRGVRLARNSGSHAAVRAGLAQCAGACAVVLAADLQDPPELLTGLLANWRTGGDIIWATRAQRRGVGLFGRWSSRFYWSVMRHIALPETPPHGADVVLLDRKVINALTPVTEKNTSLLALLAWMGFRQQHVPYVKAPRAAGRSGWTLAKRCKLAVDSVVSFSTLPIRLTWWCGSAFLAAAVVWAIALLGGWRPLGGADALIIGLLLVGFGLLLTFVGALGEYVWRAYDETRGRPMYLIERFIGSQVSGFVPVDPLQEVPCDAYGAVHGPENAIPTARVPDHAGPATRLRQRHVHAGADG
jgi:dolichol-phosphate mannosyltransferase